MPPWSYHGRWKLDSTEYSVLNTKEEKFIIEKIKEVSRKVPDARFFKVSLYSPHSLESSYYYSSEGRRVERSSICG
jgi:hypothetical protein